MMRDNNPAPGHLEDDMGTLSGAFGPAFTPQAVHGLA
jgi:hypothetical protein